MADARLSDLLEHYHLKEDDVNKELEIQDIEAISYSCKSKWKYLLIRLGLKEMDFADAENLKTDQEKRSQNLTNWKQKKGSDATFKRLIIAQLEIECRDDAENVCKILQDTLNTTQDTEPTVSHNEDFPLSPNSSNPSSTLQSPIDSIPKVSHYEGIPLSPKSSNSSSTLQSPIDSIPQVTPSELHSPQWNVNVENLTKSENGSLLTKLHKDFDWIKQKFSSLVMKTLQKLKLKNIDCNELKLMIKSYVPKLFKSISKQKSLNEIFEVLIDYWSFFDYELLGFIISFYCAELEEDKLEYIKDFETYCERKVSEIPTNIKSKVSGTHYNITIKVKIGKDRDNVKFKELKKLQTKLRKHTKMNLTLLGVEDGSIVVVFEALIEEDYMIPLSEKDENELFEMGVLKLYSDNFVYYEHNVYQHLTTSDSTDAQPQQAHQSTFNIMSVEEESIDYPQDKTTSATIPESLKQYSHIGEDNLSSTLFRPSHEDTSDMQSSPGLLKLYGSTYRGIRAEYHSRSHQDVTSQYSDQETSPMDQNLTEKIIMNDHETSEVYEINRLSLRGTEEREMQRPDQESEAQPDVEDTDDETLCPICLENAKDPRLHALCGKMFCEKCLNDYGNEKPCPCCRDEQPEYYFETSTGEREIQQQVEETESGTQRNRHRTDTWNDQEMEDFSHAQNNQEANEITHLIDAPVIRSNQRRKFKVKCQIIIPPILGVLLTIFIPYLTIIFLIPNIQSGDVIIGSSDVILISEFESHADTVKFNVLIDSLDIIFYQQDCLEIDKLQNLSNYTRELANLDNIPFRVDEPYLLVGSTVHYTFTASGSELLSDCAANIHVFTDYTNYFNFILTGQVLFEDSSHCLSAGSVNFTLSAMNINQYYFVGLKSSIDLNYTRISNILEYNITNLSSTNCTFSSAASECLISLDNSRSGDLCVLASLLHTEFHVFISLNYTTEYEVYTSYKYSALMLFILNFIMSFVVIITLCVSIKMKCIFYEENLCTNIIFMLFFIILYILLLTTLLVTFIIKY